MSSPVALITGSARRIGAAIADTLHQTGYRVILHVNHSQKEAKALCATLNLRRKNSAHVIEADLANPNTPDHLIESSITWAGQLDVLIHNASYFARDNTDDAMLFDKLFTVNVKAPYALSLKAHPHLKKQKGSILYLTDIHALRPLKGYAFYCQTKAALTAQMLAFAKSFAPNVRVNAIAPGAIAWPEGNNALSAMIQKKIIQETPLQMPGKPRYIAEAALALIQNPFITGVVLPVDGGRSTLTV